MKTTERGLRSNEEKPWIFQQKVQLKVKKLGLVSTNLNPRNGSNPMKRAEIDGGGRQRRWITGDDGGADDDDDDDDDDGDDGDGGQRDFKMAAAKRRRNGRHFAKPEPQGHHIFRPFFFIVFFRST